MKDEFIDEIKKIKGEDLRNAALEMIKDVPDYFWTDPASSSGKYHPEISLGEGGLARHSIMTCVIAKDLLESEIFVPYSDEAHDLVIVTALFHDIIKYGNKSTKHTVFDHPLLSSKFVKEHLKKTGIKSSIVDIISKAVACHMGKWNTSSYSKAILPKPATNFERLIHTADYMASRKYMGKLDKWKV